MSTVVHIVPNYPPAVDGVGDYVQRLVDVLLTQGDVRFQILVGEPALNQGRQSEGCSPAFVASRSATALAKALEGRSRVALHYVGYGYHKRGIPFWLVNGIQKWKQTDARRFLTTFFHETWASGSPWQSAFWLGPLQRRLAKRLAAMSDVTLTSCRVMAAQIRTRQTEPLVAPIPPLVGAASAGERSWLVGGKARVLVFGQAAMRSRALEYHLPILKTLARCGRLHNVTLAGAGGPTLVERRLLTSGIGDCGSAPVVFCGKLEATALRELFLNTDLLLTYHPIELACKSTVIMTALATGTVPVVRFQGREGELIPGKEVLLRENFSDVTPFPDLAQHGLSGIIWSSKNASWKHVGAIWAEALAS